MRERRGDAVFAFLLAGGEGRRLRPLTERLPKPLVPFGAAHRIIDFALANLDAAGVRSVLLPGPARLADDLADWRSLWTRAGGRLDVFPPPDARFAGTGDAAGRALDAIDAAAEDAIAVLPSDQVYGRCLPGVLEFHRRGRHRITLAVARVPLVEAAQLGVVTVTPDGRLAEYHEKPDVPESHAADGGACLVSTGIFLFDPERLRAALRGAPPGDLDLSPALFPPEEIAVCPIDTYWRDAGTIGAYWRAHMDLLDPGSGLDPADAAWPGPPGAPRAVHVTERNSLHARSCVACPDGVRRSVLGERVVVHPTAVVEESILLADVRVGAGARLTRVIVDGPNDVPEGTVLDGTDDPAGARVIAAGTC